MGVYSRMGYEVLLLSAKTGFGMERFARRLAGRESVVAGQSGVGKSSLLNAVDPTLQLPVSAVSEENRKGPAHDDRRPTAAALLRRLCGRYARRASVSALGRDSRGGGRILSATFAPYASLCRFPDCTHTHEDDCTVKDAVADGRVDQRRYESYCHLISGQEEG